MRLKTASKSAGEGRIPSWPARGVSLLTKHAPEILIWFGIPVLWELWGRSQNPYLFTYPSATFRAALDIIKNGELAQALRVSLQDLAVGFCLAAILGVGLGLLIGRYLYLGRLLNPLLLSFYVTPRIALLPLVVMWFGVGFRAKIVVVWLISFFPIFFNVLHGVHNISRSYVEVARAYGANERQVMWEVTLPAIIPFIATGLRLGLGLALVGMIVAEFFVGVTGLGGLIVIYSAEYNVAELFVAVITIIVLGVILMALANWLERRTAHWQETERAFR